jgi:proteasome lid subunit RPN8/RPN11
MMKKYRLHISSEDFSRLKKHAEDMHPTEAVALLFGIISGASVSTTRIELMENIALANHTSFSVDPEAEYELLIGAEEQDELLVGIFHSHPAPPQPSSTDLRNMRLNPVVWLVASKLSGNWIIKGYLLENDEILEVAIHVFERGDSIP